MCKMMVNNFSEKQIGSAVIFSVSYFREEQLLFKQNDFIQTLVY